MKSPKFTPGPYRIEEVDKDEYVIVGLPTWPCRRFGISGEWEVAKLDDLCGDHPREVAANARLFARADQLFAFVQIIAKQNPVFAKGADKVTIAQARLLVAEVLGQ